MSERLLEVETCSITGEKARLYVPYDKLIIAVGSTAATHGVTGLENCFQLKTIADAQKIRQRVIDNFELASLPTTSPQERKRLLSFVVCGGGPTGVETAAEIYDLCQEDIMNYYPKICRQDVSIHVIQSREHILNTVGPAHYHKNEAHIPSSTPKLSQNMQRASSCMTVLTSSRTPASQLSPLPLSLTLLVLRMAKLRSTRSRPILFSGARVSP